MDAVIFDVGGVLLVPDHVAVSAAVQALGVSVDAPKAERAHYAGIRALDASPDDVLVERRAYMDAYMEAIEIPTHSRGAALAALRPLWNGPNLDLWRQPVRGSVDGLRRLAATTDLKLGIVSNADGSIEEQLRRGRICQVGEGLGVPVLAIVDSHVVGVAKPAAEIFRHALEPLGVLPSRAMYVGDTVRYDVRGARAAGLWPLHFDPYRLCPHQADHPHAATFDDIAVRAA